MGKESFFDLTLPAQDLSSFTHFTPDAESARTWAGQLPVTNIRAVSALLLTVLEDLNRLPLSPEVRFDILATLSDNLRVTLTNLTRRFLNQPLVMPAEPQQLADRTDALLAGLQTAYCITARDIQRNQDNITSVNPARLLCEALYHALHFAGRRILLAFQLHRPVPVDSWQSIHRLYATGEWQGLAQLPVEISHEGSVSMRAAYLQALMLGCIKPNQLLQSDLQAAYHAFGEWRDDIQIGPAGEVKGLFTVDLASDQPATYSALFGNAVVESHRNINCEALVAHLRVLREPENGYNGKGVLLGCGLVLSDNMLAHLTESLGGTYTRNFRRRAEPSQVLVSIGISGAHYHAAGAQSFQQLLRGRNYHQSLAGNLPPPLSTRARDSGYWEGTSLLANFDIPSPQAGQVAERRHNVELDFFTQDTSGEMSALPEGWDVPVYRVNQRDASPGGYCLVWDEKLPEGVRTGEILCIKENPRTTWSISVIRWVSRLENAETLIGVELLSPRAAAYGIQTHHKMGQSSIPQRGLELPEISLIGQPPTLITPKAGFREGMKVSLLRNGEARHVQLRRQLVTTASFSQFEFRELRRLDELLAGEARGPLDSVYDSVWSNI